MTDLNELLDLKQENKELKEKLSKLDDYLEKQHNNKLKRNLIRHALNIIKLNNIYNFEIEYENLRNTYDADYYNLDSRYQLDDWRYCLNREENTYRCQVFLKKLDAAPIEIKDFITNRLPNKGAALFKFLNDIKSKECKLNNLSKENIDFEWE